MPSYTFPFDYTCTTITASKGTFCLPIRIDCTPTPVDSGTLTEQGNEWNLNLCQADSCYFIPYKKGDKFQIQTLFVDNGRDMPTAYSSLIQTQLLDIYGDIVSSSISAFSSQQMSGWNGKYNYQIMEVDTSIIDLTCFSIRFVTADQTLVTQQFQEEKRCQDTLLIKSNYVTKDCNGLWYGEPETFVGSNIMYDNSMRYYAFINIDGDTINKERVGRKPTQVTVSNFFTLTMRGLVPPFIKSTLVNTHLAGERVFIDGNEFIFDEVSVEPIRNSGNMSHFSVRATKECNIIYNC